MGLSVLWSLRLSRPAPKGNGRVDHASFAPILDHLKSEGLPRLVAKQDELATYVAQLEQVDPDALTPDESLAYWLNLYNAGALRLVAEAYDRNLDTVLRIPGGFSRPLADVSGKRLSLDAIEHAKIRRFKDPRIHGSLVCGSASCPTLRYEPFDASRLHEQLDDQMRVFLAGGGAVLMGDKLLLSRIFRWFGGDIVRPHRMPTFLPARPDSIASALTRWMRPDLADRVKGGELLIAFQPYDWSLGCSIT